jgi:hypothetical protein
MTHSRSETQHAAAAPAKDKARHVRLAYQPPANSTFLSEQISHQQPTNSTFLSEQTSTNHQPPANRLFICSIEMVQKIGLPR